MNVMKYTQMLRLKRASFQLVFKPEVKVIEIALDAGFDSPEAFARAFKRSFDQTPSVFRVEPNWQNWHRKFVYFTPKSELEMNVTIIERPVEKIAYISHQGSPEKYLKLQPSLSNGVKEQGCLPLKHRQPMVFLFRILSRRLNKNFASILQDQSLSRLILIMKASK